MKLHKSRKWLVADCIATAAATALVITPMIKDSIDTRKQRIEDEAYFRGWNKGYVRGWDNCVDHTPTYTDNRDFFPQKFPTD